MRFSIYLFSLLMLLLSNIWPWQTGSMCYAQAGGEEILDRVETALQQGNAVQLLELSAEQIEIALFGVNTLYSKSQARYVLEDFFEQYPVRSFRLSKPTKAGGNLFSSGAYRTTAQEQQLRVYIRLRQQQSTWRVREIRVDSVIEP